MSVLNEVKQCFQFIDRFIGLQCAHAENMARRDDELMAFDDRGEII
jgi:hypothetical protein